VDQVDQLESAQVKVHLGHLKAPNSAISQGKVGIDSRYLHLPAALISSTVNVPIGVSVPVQGRPSIIKDLWCGTLSHRHFCTTKIGRSNFTRILIPLTKML
jgi:hypothetical protein